MSSKPMLRNSAFELLRIVAMFLILLHHLLLKFTTTGYPHQTFLISDHSTIISATLESFAIVGVNVFVMISGYFGIKSKRRSLFRLLETWIWCAVLLTISSDFQYHDYVRISNWWFFGSFVVLVLVSDFIERSIKGVTLKKFSLWILILTFVNCYWGWKKGILNENGYNYVNFIFLYYIGRYIRLVQESKNLPTLPYFGLGIHVCISIVMGLAFTYLNVKDSIHFWSYNNPCIIISSVGLLLVFSQISFHSRIVNYFSVGCFGFYLLHTKAVFHTMFLNDNLRFVYDKFSYFGVILFAIVVLFISLLFTATIEHSFRKIVAKTGIAQRLKI